MKQVLYSMMISAMLLIGIGHMQAQTSPLGQGHWYKVAVLQDGVYAIGQADLQAMGFNMQTLQPAQLCVYGLTGAPLPEAADVVAPMGIQEQAIAIVGGSDGSFDADDKLLFYGVGTNTWRYQASQGRYEWIPNHYADTNYYFIGLKASGGKRIDQQQALTSADKDVFTTLSMQVHNKDEHNLLKSGRIWLGESFSSNTAVDYSFQVPDLYHQGNIYLDMVYATTVKQRATYLNMLINGQINYRFEAPPVMDNVNYTVANHAQKQFTFKSSSNTIDLHLTYDKEQANDNVFLDYYVLNAPVYLTMENKHQLAFNHYLASNNQSSMFKISHNADMQTKVWNVADPYNVKEIHGHSFHLDTLQFAVKGQGLYSYIAFDNKQYMHPIMLGEIANQDLKAFSPFDMLIVAPAMFLEQAERLAEMHRQRDGMQVKIVDVSAIYNEFSSGKQDPAAIRNFIKFYYDKAEQTQQPRYVLLFGDASYDYKDYYVDNTNIVPTYESWESFDATKTYCLDDFFGMMHGYSLRDSTRVAPIDVSVGRFPAHSLEQARVCVDKTLRYCQYFDEPLLQRMGTTAEAMKAEQAGMGLWRNKVLFVADDSDSNRHINKAEYNSKVLEKNYPVYNIGKIYLDSYVLEQNGGGLFFPEATRALNTALDEGILFFNYNGHGGHTGLTGENLLKTYDVLNWKNIDKLAVFLVASCEFGPFDEPHHISTGEHVLFSPNGGGVAIMTTTRLAASFANGAINRAIMSVAFGKQEDGTPYTLGEIVKYAKNYNNNSPKLYNFSLLGDPAISIGYAHNHVRTTAVSNKYGSVLAHDTLKGRQKVHVEADVLTDSVGGLLMSQFEGKAHISVYGYPSTYYTLVNQTGSIAVDFQVRDKLLYKGEATVSKGKFAFDFVVPEEVGAEPFRGRISYYVQSNKGPWQDAKGVDSSFMMGGVDASIAVDTEPPRIAAYINDRQFEEGQQVSNPAVLLLDLFDNTGLNNINWSFGREMQAVLDDQEVFYLNDIFVSTSNSSSQGCVKLPLPTLSMGYHSVKVKVWDIFDNYAEKEIGFYLASDNQLHLLRAYNYPNPCTRQTTFVVEHNMNDASSLQVHIQVYDVYGGKVWDYNKEQLVEGNKVLPIKMEATNSPIGQLVPGVYTYLVEIKNNKGQYAQQKQKFIVVR